MDPAILKGLNHVKYENRKAAALDLDRLLRECASSQDPAQVNRIPVIMDQLCVLFTTPTNSQSTRNGGLLGLASGAIALGFDVVPYLPRIIPPILSCFQDTDSRMRYFGVECIYNIGKVVREELLLFFNEIFDDINKLSADSDLVVKNGAELLDRLLKDMVAESASTYVTQRPYHHPSPVNPDFASTTDAGGSLGDDTVLFSLERFIPLLKERIYVVSPHTRLHLTSWITVLDSVPELELVSYLPAFLDGLLKYLSDDSVDVRTATENVLSDFLREIRDIAKVKKQQAEESQARVLANGGGPEEHSRRRLKRRESKTTMGSSTTNGGGAESEREKESWEDEEEADGFGRRDEDDEDEYGEEGEDWEGKGSGSWIPGQGVVVPYAEIVDILLRHVSYPNENIQSTALQWLSEFIIFAQDVMIPVTPSLLPQVLPYLAHPSPAIQAAATQTNLNIYRAILALPSPSPLPPTLPSHPTSDSLSSQLTAAASISGLPASSSTASVPPSSIIRRDSALTVAEDSSPPNNNLSSSASTIKPRTNSSTTTSSTGTATPAPTKPSLDTHISDSPLTTPTVSTEDKQLGFGKGVTPSASSTQPGTPAQLSFPSIGGESPVQPPSTGGGPSPVEEDPFDYQQTVNVLTLQFLSDSEDTRVAALEWLLMLHQKAPKKILAIDDGTFPVLLKTLSDPAEEVIKRDLRLLAQISSSSEDSYFTSFMVNLLELFSTDRRLLETRGSLIIRQLCLNLNSERIYRTLAQILETEEDLEFAGSMVQKLNIILITSTELVDFRKRLKNLDSKDGQMLFSIIYRSWCHSPVAVFSLCLLAQAYEHASNLLQLFADLDTTLQLLVQIDKLVQLIESPVFTSLRLQLLEPEKYPYLFKCLYGLLMLLPQSTAFVSLRNRLSAVSSMGFLHIPKPTYTPNPTPRSKLSSPDEIKWRELLAHFRSVQARHEKARRSQQQQQSGGNASSLYPSSNFGGGNDSTWSYEGAGMGGHQHQPSGSSRQTSVSSIPSSSTGTARPAARRRFGGGGTVKEESSSPSSRIASANSSIKGFEVGGSGGGGGGGRFPGMSPLNPRAGSARGASGGGGSASSSLVDALNGGGRASPVVGRSGGGAGPISGDPRGRPAEASSTQSTLAKVISTRIAGGAAALAAESEPSTVIVDMREFRSTLPSLLHASNVRIIPATLQVGDYILNPEMCVERKSIPDLIQSFNSGRLYTQCETMSVHYKQPILLIEFEQNKSFSLQSIIELKAPGSHQARSDPTSGSSNTRDRAVADSDIQSRLVLLTLTFPRLRIIWSSSPFATADIFKDLKINHSEPSAEKAILIGSADGDEGDGAGGNTSAQELLRSLPGVNGKNYRHIMNSVESVKDFCELSLAKMQEIMGTDDGKTAYTFLHRDVHEQVAG